MNNGYHKNNIEYNKTFGMITVINVVIVSILVARSRHATTEKQHAYVQQPSAKNVPECCGLS